MLTSRLKEFQKDFRRAVPERVAPRGRSPMVGRDGADLFHFDTKVEETRKRGNTEGLFPVARNNQTGSGSSELGLEAPSGVEPLHRSFADCSLNHLGTAPSWHYSLGDR